MPVEVEYVAPEEGKSLMSDVATSTASATIDKNIVTQTAQGGNGYEVTLSPIEADLEKEKNRAREIELKNQIEELTSKIEKMNAKKEQLLAELEKVSCVITARAVRNQSMIITRSYDNGKTQMMDVIDEMKKGTQILKYKRFGSTYHQFEITSDNKYLRWYSKNKKTFDKTSIPLEKIEHLQKGHLYKTDASASQHQYAFSITYMAGKNEPKTLEVMAKDKTDFHVWTKGLEFILSTIRKVKRSGQRYDPNKHFPDKHIAEIEYLDHKKLEYKLSKKEDPPKELFEKDMSSIKTKYESLGNKLSSIVYDSANDSSMDQSGVDAINLMKDRCKQLKTEIERIENHWTQSSKKLSILVYRVAWIATELNALDAKIIVLNNSYKSGALPGSDDEQMSPLKRLKSFF